MWALALASALLFPFASAAHASRAPVVTGHATYGHVSLQAPDDRSLGVFFVLATLQVAPTFLLDGGERPLRGGEAKVVAVAAGAPSPLDHAPLPTGRVATWRDAAGESWISLEYAYEVEGTTHWAYVAPLDDEVRHGGVGEAYNAVVLGDTARLGDAPPDVYVVPLGDLRPGPVRLFAAVADAFAQGVGALAATASGLLAAVRG